MKQAEQGPIAVDPPTVPNGTDKPVEYCAVVGAVSIIYPVVPSLLFSLAAQQHRGQDSSGIVTADFNGKLRFYRDEGTVAQVYNGLDFADFPGRLGIGHNRYPTSRGTKSTENTTAQIQPLFDEKLGLAFAFNGTVTILDSMRRLLTQFRINHERMNDAQMMFETLKIFLRCTGDCVTALQLSWQYWVGAFSVVALHDGRVLGLRGPLGIRPLELGELPDASGWVVASETAGITTLGGEPMGSVAPGEVVILDPTIREVKKRQIAPPQRERLDVFEIIYFMRPDSYYRGEQIAVIRKRLGAQLAREMGALSIEFDLAVPVLNSGLYSAIGFVEAAQEMGSSIRLEHALLRDPTSLRTFISSNPAARSQLVDRKHIVLASLVKRKRIALIDDSIVHGTTIAVLVKKLLEAGAESVSVCIPSPELKHPDYYGIDTPKKADLLSARMTPGAIANAIGAQSVHFLSYGGMLGAIGVAEEDVMTSAFTGKYPLTIPHAASRPIRWKKH